jgi:hypothetical protein
VVGPRTPTPVLRVAMVALFSEVAPIRPLLVADPYAKVEIGPIAHRDHALHRLVLLTSSFIPRVTA